MTSQPGPAPLQPLPVTVISGYLGAGKTTLVNAILAGDHGLRIAVLVNDFGSICVDEALISGREADVIALANGCMCCQVGGALYDAIDRILGMRGRFDHFLVETSGVADPGKIAQIAIAEPDLELARVVVLVDALNFTTCLRDPKLEDTLLRQLRAADLIFITRSAAAPAETLAEVHMALAQTAPEITTAALVKGETGALALAPARSREQGRAAPALRPHLPPFETWGWRGNGAVDREGLAALAGDPSLGAYRLKGRLRLRGGGAVSLHKVGSEITIEEIDDALSGSELVAVGPRQAFDPARFEAAWARLLAGTRPVPGTT